MSKKESVSFYYILGVAENATPDEIREAYLKWMQKIAAYEQGLSENDEKRKNAEGFAKLLNEIYQVLIDKDLKQQYDRARNQGIELLYREGSIVHYNDDDGISNNSYSFDLSEFVEKNVKSVEENSNLNTAIINNPQQTRYSNKAIGENSSTAVANTDSEIVESSMYEDDDDYIPVIDVDYSDDAEETASKGKGILKGLAIATVAALVIGTAVAIGYSLGSSSSASEDEDELGTTTTTTTIDDTPAETTTTVNQPEYVNPIVNLGDATDPKVVNEKVDNISDLLTKLGVVDPQTRKPYAKEDIKNILLFMNAAMIPETDEQAYAMVNQQIDFTCVLLSTPRVINFVNYSAGISSFTKDMVEEDIKNGTDLCLVDSMLLGDSYGYEYLKYLEDSYNDLLKTTDKEEYVKKYTKVVNSLANVVYGKSFTLDGKEFTINDFAGLDNLNDGNLLTMYVNLFSILNVDGVNQFVTVKTIDNSEATVSLEELFSNFDLICVTNELDRLYIDDDGKIVGNTENFHERVQVDTINAALENRYHGNLNAYDYNYNKSLKR